MILFIPNDPPLQEFNARHDRLGRFSSGSKGGPSLAADAGGGGGAYAALAAAHIHNPNSSGQGHDATHTANPYHEIITKHGYTYSHTTPVRSPATGQVMNHHTYTKGSHTVGVHGGTWGTSVSTASGRAMVGSGARTLDAHLSRKDRRYNVGKGS
jgi:hypothetical protein